MSVKPLFRDRHAAGVALAEALRATLTRAAAIDGGPRQADSPPIILGMARGGVVVAAPIARAFAATLDTFIARKLGVPGLEEVAFGAIAEGGGAPVLDDVHRFIGLPRAVMQSVLVRELGEVERRVVQYRDGAPLSSIAGRTVIVVDDGLASGATLRAAGIALRRHKPARMIAAVPVASIAGEQDVSATFDETVTLATPELFGTVSDWYDEYESVDDHTVRTLLGRSSQIDFADSKFARTSGPGDETIVSVPTGESALTHLVGEIGRAANAKPPRGLVIFAHGGGSSRASYRNRYLGARMRLAGWATLRVDLLGESERDADRQGALRFDIALVSRRLQAATKWCIDTRAPGSERIVLFGASTGAAAAMNVAAKLPERVMAVISRGGRIDLAREALGRVRAPTLLVIGSNDCETWQRNRESAAHLGGRVTMRVVPGAGHTFEEPGALGQAGELVSAFLTRLHRRERVTRWLTVLRNIGNKPHASACSRDCIPGMTRSD